MSLSKGLPVLLDVSIFYIFSLLGQNNCVARGIKQFGNLLQEIFEPFKKKDFHVLLDETHATMYQDASFMELLKNNYSSVYHRFPVVKRL